MNDVPDPDRFAEYWFTAMNAALIHGTIALIFVVAFVTVFRNRLSHAFAHGAFLLVPLKAASAAVFTLSALNLPLAVPVPAAWIRPDSEPVPDSRFESPSQSNQELKTAESSTKANAPQADIVYDRFHVSKHLNEAEDKVRRKENKALQQLDDDSLKGSKQLWLFAPENMSRKLRKPLNELRELGLGTGRAWAIKEALRKFWDYEYVGSARKYFGWWYSWAVRSRLKPIVEVAKMLKRHLEGLLNFIRHKVTNSLTEGFNRQIQHLKYSARGLRNFES